MRTALLYLLILVMRFSDTVSSAHTGYIITTSTVHNNVVFGVKNRVSNFLQTACQPKCVLFTLK